MKLINSLVLFLLAISIVGCGDLDSVEAEIAGIDQQRFAVTLSGSPAVIDNHKELLLHPGARVVDFDGLMSVQSADANSCDAIRCPVGLGCQRGVCAMSTQRGIDAESDDFEIDIDPLDEIGPHGSIDIERAELQLIVIPD